MRPCACGRALPVKTGSLYCQTVGQYDQISQGTQWGVFSDFCRLQEDRDYLTSHKVCWTNAFNQRKEFEEMLCCMPLVSMNGSWVPQDQLCFHVTWWLRAWHREVCPTTTFSLVFFLQYKTALFFCLGFSPEKVTPVISEPLGAYNVHVICDMSREHGMPCLAVVASIESRAVLSLWAVSGVGTV